MKRKSLANTVPRTGICFVCGKAVARHFGAENKFIKCRKKGLTKAAQERILMIVKGGENNG